MQEDLLRLREEVRKFLRKVNELGEAAIVTAARPGWVEQCDVVRANKGLRV